MKLRNKLDKIAFMLGLALTCMFFSLSAYAQPQPDTAATGQPAAKPYTAALFSANTVLKNPNSTVYAYVKINSGSSLHGNALLDLSYSYSPLTIPDISNLTVSVNGLPVTSKKLERDQSDKSNWQVEIPASYFKTGTNEIGISVIHRTIDGLCRDIDNPANWFTIRPDSKLNLSLVSGPYLLKDFPQPFLADNLTANTKTIVYLPEDSDGDTLAALMSLAAGWGRNGAAGSLPKQLEVRFGEPGQAAANEIVFGPHAKWHTDGNYPDEAPLLSFQQLANGYYRLLITGNAQSFAKAVAVLTRPELVTLLETQQVLLTAPLPAEQKSPAHPSTLLNRKKTFTLSDLGYTTDIVAAGAFHQDALVTIPRPANAKIGEGSYLELKFRHSKILDPQKSAVTIYINNIPLNSVALRAENAENGVLRAKIPTSELKAPAWHVRFGFYHDLGIVDCGKNYDEVAWSVIEKETTVMLQPGNVTYKPLWENFPHDFSVNDKGQVKLDLLISSQPSEEELAAAFKLAYYIGSQNKAQILWSVQKSSDFTVDQAEGSVIALGKSDDAEAWQKLQAYLPVTAQGGKFTAAGWLPVLPELLGAYDICQIGQLPDNNYLYAFMYQNTSQLNKLLDLTIQKASPLLGQVALLSSQGEVKAYYDKAQQTQLAQEGAEKLTGDFIGPSGTYLLIILAALAITGAAVFYAHKK